MTMSDDGDANDDVAGEGEAFRYNRINSQEPMNARDALRRCSSLSSLVFKVGERMHRNSCSIVADLLCNTFRPLQFKFWLMEYTR